jgi:hypothetical protein
MNVAKDRRGWMANIPVRYSGHPDFATKYRNWPSWESFNMAALSKIRQILIWYHKISHIFHSYFLQIICKSWLPLWSSGQISWLQIQRSRVRFQTLAGFLRSSESERGPLSLVRITEELLEWKSNVSGSRKSRLTAMGIRCADHATSISKSWH